MHPDEYRDRHHMRSLRKAAALKDPEALYARYEPLMESWRATGGAALSGSALAGGVDEAIYLLKKERDKSRSLAAELAETRSKLVALRASRTMRIGRVVATPYRYVKLVRRKISPRLKR